MKLNYDCMKAILSFAESEMEYYEPNNLNEMCLDQVPLSIKTISESLSLSYDIPTVKYAFQKLEEAGYIILDIPLSTKEYSIIAITFKGHQFLEEN